LLNIHASLEIRGPSESRLPPKESVTPAPTLLPPNDKHLKGKSGDFSAPDFPQPYKSNTDYVWIIEVPDGYVAYIQIFGISIEYVYLLAIVAISTQLQIL